MNDPWSSNTNITVDKTLTSNYKGFEDDFMKDRERLPDSHQYISKLERMLSNVQGKDRDLKSKEMVNKLQKMREDLMLNFLRSDEITHADVQDNISPSYVERKLFPERQALTQEELLLLLQSDKLAEAESDDSNQER